ncbi:HAD-IIB family hydrolase [Candidatus Parcubacteria bacterium]|nr:HAD-IIB family hydrolase [Candidatus Parcubacteria bacterium]
MVKPKLIGFDLDGTLAESKARVSAEMGELLSDLLSRMPVAIMSGGSWKQIETQLLPSLPLDTKLERLYLMPVSAGQCYVYRNQKWLPEYDHSFGPVEKEQIFQALTESLKEVGLDQIPDKIYGQQVEDRGAQITWSALGQQAPLEEKSKFDPDRRKRLPLRDALLKRLNNVNVAVNATTSVDITQKGITKAYGIRKLVELTGTPTSEMIYVGDALEEGGNDAVVIETGVRTHAVFGPKETAAFIETVLEDTKQPAVV